MEHTDAGVPVGLADARLREHVYADDGRVEPVPVPTRPPEMVLVPPACAGGVAALVGEEAGVGTDAGDGVPGGDVEVVNHDVEDRGGEAIDVTDGDSDDPDFDGDGVCADSSASSVVTLAEVVGIRLSDLFSEPMEWQERALCAQTDPEAFFPEKGGSTREAKRICAGCEVRPECLEYALANDERFGIWGGMSERERRKQRRRAV
jgi:WhiB family redox-sensing transcriptional regulator